MKADTDTFVERFKAFIASQPPKILSTDEELFLAIKSKDLEKVKESFSKGASIKAVNRVRELPVHAACREGTLEILKFLISLGADISSRCSSGDLPIHHACFQGAQDIAEFLLDNGNKLEDSGYSSSPLIIACSLGHFALARFLLDRGANINAQDGLQETALHGAAMVFYHTKDDRLYKYLIEKGIDQSVKNCEGETAAEKLIRLQREMAAEAAASGDGGFASKVVEERKDKDGGARGGAGIS